MNVTQMIFNVEIRTIGEKTPFSKPLRAVRKNSASSVNLEANFCFVAKINSPEEKSTDIKMHFVLLQCRRRRSQWRTQCNNYTKGK